MTKPTTLLSEKGYWGRYYEILPDCRSHKEAWERLEAELMETYGVERYTSYESFRVMKTKYLQGLKD